MTAIRDIGFIGFDQVNAFDLTGPFEVFATANAQADPERPPYRLHLIAPEAGAFRGESGLSFLATTTLAEAPPLDTIVIPGGCGLRDPAINAAVSPWLGERLAETRRIATVCTGIYALAPTGALDGLDATTHWRFVEDIRQRFPAIRIDPDSIYVRSGRFSTSGGITAGLDLSLALVSEDLGARAALAIAREMLVHVVRTGGQAQFSEPVRAQSRVPDGLSGLIAWIGANLDRELSVETLANRAGICERQLSRRFHDGLGEAPAPSYSGCGSMRHAKHWRAARWGSTPLQRSPASRRPTVCAALSSAPSR